MSQVMYCGNCPKLTCAKCCKGGHATSECRIVPLCELCHMKEEALAQYFQAKAQMELVTLCEEIEKDHELSTLSIPNITFEAFDPQPPEKGITPDNFEHVLNFWCTSPWWWNDELAFNLQMGPPRE